jgi:hypothetical protein
MKCDICHREIDVIGTWKLGHNAQPIVDGRCCSECNDYIVIPARLAPVMGAKKAALTSAYIARGMEDARKGQNL